MREGIPDQSLPTAIVVRYLVCLINKPIRTLHLFEECMFYSYKVSVAPNKGIFLVLLLQCLLISTAYGK